MLQHLSSPSFVGFFLFSQGKRKLSFFLLHFWWTITTTHNTESVGKIERSNEIGVMWHQLDKPGVRQAAAIVSHTKISTDSKPISSADIIRAHDPTKWDLEKKIEEMPVLLTGEIDRRGWGIPTPSRPSAPGPFGTSRIPSTLSVR